MRTVGSQAPLALRVCFATVANGSESLVHSWAAAVVHWMLAVAGEQWSPVRWKVFRSSFQVHHLMAWWGWGYLLIEVTEIDRD